MVEISNFGGLKAQRATFKSGLLAEQTHLLNSPELELDRSK